MERLPSAEEQKNSVKFTIGDFYTKGKDRLQLTLLVGGAGLNGVIGEPMVNRPGLALTGFFEHFAFKRLQLIGKAETAYLQSLGEDEALKRIDSLFERGAGTLIFTGGMQPTVKILKLASERGKVVFSSPLKTRVFSHHSAFVLESLSAPRTSIYGTTIEVCGLGVMVEGDPGLGKSETALGLIKRGHALVADDLTCIRKDVANNILYASASQSTAGYMEIRGIGIIDVGKIFGVTAVRGEKHLQMVVTFKRLKDIIGEIDRVGQKRRYKSILGVDVPQVIIPVSEGRDLVNLVEMAAQQYKLSMSGVDPVDELSERLKMRADAILNSSESAV